VLDWSRAQVVVMRPGPDARALNAVVRDLMNTRDGATYFAGRVWGVLTRYDLGDAHPLVGRSVPNFEFEDGVRMGELMHDGRGVLLDFGLCAALKDFSDEFCGRVRYISGRAKEALGLNAVLIRPDGVVAWAGEGDWGLGAVREAAGRWFVGY
jgi:hypothetical protein